MARSTVGRSACRSSADDGPPWCTLNAAEASVEDSSSRYTASSASGICSSGWSSRTSASASSSAGAPSTVRVSDDSLDRPVLQRQPPGAEPVDRRRPASRGSRRPPRPARAAARARTPRAPWWSGGGARPPSPRGSGAARGAGRVSSSVIVGSLPSSGRQAGDATSSSAVGCVRAAVRALGARSAAATPRSAAGARDLLRSPDARGGAGGRAPLAANASRVQTASDARLPGRSISRSTRNPTSAFFAAIRALRTSGSTTTRVADSSSKQKATVAAMTADVSPCTGGPTGGATSRCMPRSPVRTSGTASSSDRRRVVGLDEERRLRVDEPEPRVLPGVGRDGGEVGAHVVEGQPTHLPEGRGGVRQPVVHEGRVPVPVQRQDDDVHADAHRTATVTPAGTPNSWNAIRRSSG